MSTDSRSDAWLTFEPGRYYLGLWWVEVPKVGDLLAWAFRIEDSSPETWHLGCRRRLYRDDRVWDSQDEKEGSEWVVRVRQGDDGEEKAVLSMELIAAAVAKHLFRQYAVQLNVLWIRGDCETASRVLREAARTIPYFHAPDGGTEAEDEAEGAEGDGLDGGLELRGHPSL